ncbi:peptide ABC transporter substrate-binding protein [Actinophytocola gossypii]|uniref:ABC transporter substrate-binding protein n=1 Tax=Actinophytocola gossypii TaxID=2812003 RepID=A0ABT2J5K6_9PSEU|nr:ABC transporter substrate-binding protein [Actinophytocola gossypii]MCT2583051.1 ABC transporter substrate-binding protein [Actinophytocola gossypii]
MRRPRWKAAVVMSFSAALVLTSCGGGGEDDQSGGGGDPDKTANATISVFGTEPERPLVPGDTSETGGGKIIDALFTGLVDYDPVTGEPGLANAESFELTAPDQYTVKLKEGWTFHDGTPVLAHNYVDAWNYTAYSPNGQQHASFFAQIEGFDQVFTVDPDGDGPQKPPTPPAETLSGLKVVDDYTFTIDFTNPHAVFKTKTGYAAFMPLPDSFFEDKAAFEENPIGNGPWKYVSRVPNRELVVERYEEYQGDDKPKVKGVNFTFTDSDAAYVEVKGNQLDFIDTLPPQAIAGNVWKDDLPGRADVADVLAIQVLAFPVYDPKYQSADFRHAVSMAIDRQAVIDAIYEGNRKPATGYGVPKLPGWEPGACGEYCEFKPDEAKALFEKSGWTGPIEITSNSDGGHKEWVEAVCGQISNNLGVDCTFVPVQEFSQVRQAINAREMDQIYRAGWLADYALVENFLNPLYRTGGSSNDNGYSNPEVDAKLAAADSAESEEEAFKLYHEAEQLIAEDMPAIPLWNTPSIYGWSERLTNVRLTPKRELDLAYVEVK